MMATINLIGQRFNMLTVIDQLPSVYKHSVWLCVCDCGNIVALRTGDRKKKIGCRDCFVKRHRKHGKSFTKEYRAWRRMKDRCDNENIDMYHNYGGRGITYCERWLDFKNFLLDMGESPSSKHSIDRIDVNGNYEPGNCRWATISEQNRNKRTNRFITINGETRCVQEWCEIYKIRYGLFFYRTTQGGMDEVSAITTPLDKKKSRNGKKASHK